MQYKINIKCNLNTRDDYCSENIKLLKNEIMELNNIYMQSDEKVSYYYEDIITGSVLSYNSDILFYAASAIKVLVAAMIFELADNGEINLEDKILISMSDLKHDTGLIKFQKEDTYYSIKELVRLAIVESDNNAYIKIVNYVGKDKLEQYGKSLGALHTMEGRDLFGLINSDDMIIYWKKVKSFIDNSPLGK